MKKILFGILVLMFITTTSAAEYQNYVLKPGDGVVFSKCSTIEFMSGNAFPGSKGMGTFLLYYRGRPFMFTINATYTLAFYPEGDNVNHFFKFILNDINFVIEGGNSVPYANISVLNSLSCEGGGVEVNVDPDTINKKSRGNWITAYIESQGLSDEWLVDVDLSCFEEGGGTPPASFTLKVGDGVEFCNMTIELEVVGGASGLTAVFSVGYGQAHQGSGIKEGSYSGTPLIFDHLEIHVDDIYTRDYPENFAFLSITCRGLHNLEYHSAEEDVVQCVAPYGHYYLRPISIDKETHSATFELEYPQPFGPPITETFTMNDKDTKYLAGMKIVLLYTSRGFIKDVGDGFNVMNIDINTVTLTTPDGSVFYAINDPRYGFVKDPQPHDEDEDGIPEFMVKFWRMPIQKVLPDGLVDLIVSGETYDGATFEGSDTVRVIGNLFNRFKKFPLRLPRFS